MNYEEKKARLLAILQTQADGDQNLPQDLDVDEPSQFFEQAKQNWETFYLENAKILARQQGFADFSNQPEQIAQAIASVAGVLRSILLQTGAGIEGAGRIEGVEREPYFEVVIRPGARLSAVPTNNTGMDARVQVSGSEIAQDLEHRLNIDSETALKLWTNLAKACEEWAKTPFATPLFPGLHLTLRNRSVTVELDKAMSFGLD